MKVHIHRQSHYAGSLRRFRVIANDKFLTCIRVGEEETLELPQPCTLRVRLDFQRSNKLEVTPDENGRANVIIRWRENADSYYLRQLEMLRLQNMELRQVSETEYERFKRQGDPIEAEPADERLFQEKAVSEIALGLLFLWTSIFYQGEGFEDSDVRYFIFLLACSYIPFSLIHLSTKNPFMRTISHLKVSSVINILVFGFFIFTAPNFPLIITELIFGIILNIFTYARILFVENNTKRNLLR